MGGEDQGGELLEEHGAIKAVASVLKEEALLPVLLTLAREQRQPSPVEFFLYKAADDQPRRRPESPPVQRGAHRVHRRAYRTSPPLNPHPLGQLIEAAADVSMSPHPSPTADAVVGAGPRIALSQIDEQVYVDR